MQWVYLSLAVIAVIGIWDCKIYLCNIQRLLFEEQARRNKKQYNQAVWGSSADHLE